MTLTRSNVEFLIEARVGPLMTTAGMAVTVAGSNADLNGPIGRAVRLLGYTTADFTSVADVDVALVSDSKLDELLDLVELFALEAILGNYDDVDITVGPRSEKLSQTISQLDKRIAAKYKSLARLYGQGLATLTSGIITLNIAEHD